jgi:hypothetical protein
MIEGSHSSQLCRQMIFVNAIKNKKVLCQFYVYFSFLFFGVMLDKYVLGIMGKK